MTTIKVDKVIPKTGTSLALGDSGDTFTIPAGATLVNDIPYLSCIDICSKRRGTCLLCECPVMINCTCFIL